MRSARLVEGLGREPERRGRGRRHRDEVPAEGVLELDADLALDDRIRITPTHRVHGLPLPRHRIVVEIPQGPHHGHGGWWVGIAQVARPVAGFDLVLLDPDVNADCRDSGQRSGLSSSCARTFNITHRRPSVVAVPAPTPTLTLSWAEGALFPPVSDCVSYRAPHTAHGAPCPA